MTPFTQFNDKILPGLNELARKVEGLSNLQGDAYLNVGRVANGTGVTLNIEAIRRKIAKRPDPESKTKIFQVRSLATPQGTTSAPVFRKGLYSCLEVVIDSSRWAGGVTQFRDIVIDVDEAYDTGAGNRDYDEWDASTSYSPDDIIQVTTDYTVAVFSDAQVVKVYKSLTNNIGIIPADNPSDWSELTVEVLNLKEANQGVLSNNGTTKLIQFDLIMSNAFIDSAGESRWAGNDNIGSTRLFQTTGNTIGGLFTASAFKNVSALNHVTVGQLGFEIPFIQGGTRTGNDYDFTGNSLAVIQLTWRNGWFFEYNIPEVDTTKGLAKSGNIIVAKVDGTSIEFDGNGDISTV